MKKTLTILGLIALYVFLASISVSRAFAGCGQYGGTCPTVSQMVVDKFIKDPNQKGDIYVDNLNLANYHFSPGEDIIFKIVVKNTGNVDLNNAQVKETIPVLTDYVLENGDVRSDIRDVNKTYSVLHAGESQEFFIRVRVKPSSQVPAGITCGDPNAINRVFAWADNQSTTSDTASFCIEKGVLGAVAQPQAGAELWIVAAGLLAISGFGFLGKKAFERV